MFSEPPDASAYLPGWRPPIMGGLGAMTVSTAAGKVLTGSSPRRFFGAFLIVQKGTPVPKIKRDGHRAIPKKR